MALLINLRSEPPYSAPYLHLGHAGSEETLSPPKIRKISLIGPECAKPAHQTTNPIGGLERLIAMTLRLHRGFDKTGTRMISVEHGPTRFGDESLALLVLIDNDQKPFFRGFGELVQPFHRLSQYREIHLHWTMLIGCSSLVHTNIEDVTAASSDSV